MEKSLIDLHELSNGTGRESYGGSLMAYSLDGGSTAEQFSRFKDRILESVGRAYLPVYRLADGELRFLFGEKVNWKSNTTRSLGRYIRGKILGRNWKTSWGESYSPTRLSQLRSLLAGLVASIAEAGILAIYWNENGLDAFIEYNRSLNRNLEKIGVVLSKRNYVPFHFCQGLVARFADQLFKGRRVLIISGIGEQEQAQLRERLLTFGVNSVEFRSCSKSNALLGDYCNLELSQNPEITLVAAGIGSAKVIADVRYLECPVIDIGSMIHVLSGVSSGCHAGFFKSPF